MKAKIKTLNADKLKEMFDNPPKEDISYYKLQENHTLTGFVCGGFTRLSFCPDENILYIDLQSKPRDIVGWNAKVDKYAGITKSLSFETYIDYSEDERGCSHFRIEYHRFYCLNGSRVKEYEIGGTDGLPVEALLKALFDKNNDNPYALSINGHNALGYVRGLPFIALWDDNELEMSCIWHGGRVLNRYDPLLYELRDRLKIGLSGIGKVRYNVTSNEEMEKDMTFQFYFFSI